MTLFKDQEVKELFTHITNLKEEVRHLKETVNNLERLILWRGGILDKLGVVWNGHYETHTNSVDLRKPKK